MRLLPSERKQKEGAAIKKFLQEKKLNIYEPCNCGNMIQHNNGGNYHEIITLIIDEGRYFVAYDTTFELDSPAEWEEINEEKALDIIKANSDWL